MTDTTRNTEARIARTIAACQRQGVTVGGVRVWPDGSIMVLATDAVPALPSPGQGENDGCDDAFGGRP